MNQQIKEKWMNALRSGEYSQTRGALRTTEGFCCLGVLCDLYSKETGTEWGEYQKDFANSSFLGELATFPPKVGEWSGIERANPYFEEVGTLASLNDGGKEFTEIADVIEKYL